MLWPIVMPFKITFWTMTLLVVAVTAIAPKLKWQRSRAFRIGIVTAMLVFVPSCTGIMFAVNAIQFGYFEYTSFDDINDFRAQRYLPPAATDIQMYKDVQGYRAKYKISTADFDRYIDRLWNEQGKYSITKRGAYSDDGSAASADELDSEFGDLGWNPLDNAVIYHSPTEDDGGGARYFFDAQAGIAFQITGYW